MDEAAREDRERFFAVADAMTFQPKYRERQGELEAVKQQWRDMTALPGYPCIVWPMALPEWFPTVHFASNWGEGYLEKTLEWETDHDEINAWGCEELPLETRAWSDVVEAGSTYCKGNTGGE